ncbi:MAG: acyl--CoA ligase [Mesorhizobium sp.]|nr:class I adenylate-forming enzyme family protein [Mesorhizobium sp.]MCO5164592.1 acyl--CoA ligase [Mesorhizobium sp.]
MAEEKPDEGQAIEHEERRLPRVLWRILKRHAELTPNKTFLLSDTGAMTYAEAWETVRSISRGLISAGVAPGDRVAMLTPPEEAFPLVYLATSMVGAIWLGINTRFTESEIRFLIEDARPAILITRDKIGERDFATLFARLKNDYPFVSTLHVVTSDGLPPAMLTGATPDLERVLDARAEEVQPDDAALIVYTSGSTGRPKGAVLSNRAVVENIAVQVRRFGLVADDRFLLHLPPNHVAGNIEILIGGFYAGCTIVLLPEFDTPRLARTIRQFKVTALMQIPTLYVMMFNDPAVTDEDLASLRKLYWAGSAAPRAMVETMRRRIPLATLVTGYGMTEVCGFVTYTQPSDHIEDLMDTVGAIDPAFALRIVDDTRQPVPVGERGEIALRGAVLMKGYWNRDDATAEAIDADGWYYTGDLGVIDDRGYVTLVGRKKDMYISGGFNVYPREIEIALESEPRIALACVLAEPDPVFQEIGVAFVVPKAGETIDPAELTAFCRERLANYKVPKRFVLRDSLPMLGVGKIDRMALRAELQDKK